MGTSFFIGEIGTPIVLQDKRDNIPNTTQTLISFTITAGQNRKISNVLVVSRAHGNYELTVDGTVIGSGRTGPSSLNSQIKFDPKFPLNTGQVVNLLFKSLSGLPIQSVESYIYMVDI